MELMIAAGLLAAAIVVAALVMRSRPVAAPDPARARTAAEPPEAVPPASTRATEGQDAPPSARNGSTRLDGDTGSLGPGRTGQWPATTVDAPAPPAGATRRNGAAPNGAHAADPAPAPAPSAAGSPPGGSALVPPSAPAGSAPALARPPATVLPAPTTPDPATPRPWRPRSARRLEEIDRRERRLGDRERELDGAARSSRRPRERSSASSSGSRDVGGQAKQALLKDVEDDARHERALVLRQVEEETKRDAERRVRSILSVAMQRLAASHATETT
jgi:hypothetical protein